MNKTLLDTTDTTPVPRLATPEQVAALVGYCLSEERVKKWTYEKAGLFLNKLNREDRVVRARARATGAQYEVKANDGTMVPIVRNVVDEFRRREAGKAVRDAGGQTVDELYMAVAAAVWMLDEFEIRRLAKHFVATFDPPQTETERAA